MINLLEIQQSEDGLKPLYQDIERALLAEDKTALENYITILDDKDNATIEVGQNMIAGVLALHISFYNTSSKGNTKSKRRPYIVDNIKISKQALSRFMENSLIKEWQEMHPGEDPFADVQKTLDNVINDDIACQLSMFTDEGSTSALKYYHMLVQGKASNKLQKKITERIAKPAQFDLYGHGSIIDHDFKLFIQGYKELENGVKQSAAMLLDSLMIKATNEGLKSTLITLPLREYMAMRGLRDEKETRAQVKQDINALERISFEYKGTGKHRGAWLKISIAGGTVGQIKNGDILFRFNQDFFDSFRASDTGKLMYMYFPKEALQGSIKHNPYKYWLARKISEHKRMNLGKPNEDIIAVSTLIEACPNFPTYNDVMGAGRDITRRIIEPFERDLDALTESLSWHYADTEPPIDYTSFMTATVSIRWNNYPDTKSLIAQKTQRAKRQTTPRKKDNAEYDEN
jgi:hypothetical protein